ncbi:MULTISPECIES: hypothetical protein [Pseudomonas]|uniref:hypothetical protein n=1 Tax=Pseudomonas TaxID=286 RepID=UPI000C9A7B6D|nr:hypothetical protein [Pseudomonas protegens]PNG35784.1 hypothetical protein A1395_30930 [Pseudomonas protegens]ROL90302.1 hypothetical protein BK639_20650 [Pseudomonas protegens]ROM03862.1 hypothetical protein BK642_19190 [Pseudomonas protegens]ROM05965.1 hypothetical protein BK641_14455 [Pseudomonas protegens]ROM12997.1 hypothetical protein BK640_01425 [Pseudomonas protegens]
MNPILLDIIKIGFHGAAIAMAYLTYRLIHKALETNSKSDINLERIMNSVKFFMGLCVVLFVIGVGAQLFTPTPRQTMTKVMVTPSPWPEQLKTYEDFILISHEQKKINIIDGFAEIQVYDKDNIRVGAERLVNVLADLSEKNKSLLQRASPAGGFGQ